MTTPDDRLAALEARVATLEQQRADLETRLAIFEEYFSIFRNADGELGCMTRGRLGVMTEYWMRRPKGQGAAFSVGTAGDRYVGYFEAEATACPDHPTTGILVWVKCPNEASYNIGVEAHVAGSFGKPGVVLHADGDGIEVGGASAFYLGKTLGDAVRLWPGRPPGHTAAAGSTAMGTMLKVRLKNPSYLPAEGAVFDVELLDGGTDSPPPPVDPIWLQRPYIRQHLVDTIYTPYRAQPGPRGSGPIDIDYYTDVIVETGGWINPTARGENNIGYWTDKIQKDLEAHGYRRQS